jgi:hypothetical protein
MWMKLTCDAVGVKEKDVMQVIQVIQNDGIVRLYHSLPFKNLREKTAKI